MSKALIAVFALAVILRFLFFPNNIYFGYDQARDAFVSQEITHGHLKLVGPTTSIPGLFHGPLYYYIWAPLYFLSHGDPASVAIFLRFYNAFGVLIIFLIALVMFTQHSLSRKKLGFIVALLFAFSFEQTQYAIYFNHPSIAEMAVLLFYLGWSMLIFKKDKRGFILAGLALGLSIQLEFILVYLIPIFLLLLLIFRKSLKILDKKTILLAIIGFMLAISSFIVSSVKFHFATGNLISSTGSQYFPSSLGLLLNNIHSELIRFFHDNILANEPVINILLLGYLVGVVWLIKQRKLITQLKFLGVWLFAGIIPYINTQSGSPLYYYSVGATGALLIFTALLINQIWEKTKVLAILIVMIIIASNIYLIFTLNPKGSIPEINVQSGMLLSDEKNALDYIYKSASTQPFAVNALSMPYKINTTWDYLFEWYGKQKYGTVPIWGGDNAEGYPGNLKVVKVRSDLPPLQYLILEPTRGIPDYLISLFVHDENIFTKVVETKKFGSITVEKRYRF